MSQSKATVRHNIVSNNGMSLWIPAHLEGVHVGSFSDVDIYTQNSGQLFPLSTRLEYADGRMFRYGKCGATSTTVPLARLVVNNNLVPGSAATNGYEGSLDATSNYAAGSTTLVLNDETDRAENAYEDGMLVVFPTGHFCSYRILGNDAAASVDDVTIYIEEGLKTALVVNSTGVTAYPSAFSNLRQGGTGNAAYESAMGAVIASGFTATYYMWIQRRGRCYVAPVAYFGDTAEERSAMFWYSDGTVAAPTYATSTPDPSSGTQIVGYIVSMTVSGYGDSEIWLTLE